MVSSVALPSDWLCFQIHDTELSALGLCTVQALARRDWGKTYNVVRTTGIPGKIRTGDLPNRSRKRCCFSWTTQCRHSAAVTLQSPHSGAMSGSPVCCSFWRPGCWNYLSAHWTGWTDRNSTDILKKHGLKNVKCFWLRASSVLTCAQPS
jgi:hypothetical protein